jgi:hypothetical protein
MTSEEIRLLLSQTNVSFVIANIGDQLNWIDPEHCFTFWKSEVQEQIADNPDRIDLDKFPSGYAYLASRWTSDEYPIILLEKLH